VGFLPIPLRRPKKKAQSVSGIKIQNKTEKEQHKIVIAMKPTFRLQLLKRLKEDWHKGTTAFMGTTHFLHKNLQ